MINKYKDTKGNIFLLPKFIGGEERYTNNTDNLVLKSNTEYFMDYIKDNEKQIKYESNFFSDRDYSLYDVVISKKYGGHEIYIKDSPENEDLIEMINNTELYPLLDEDKYDTMVQEEYEKLFENGTTQHLFYDEMDEHEKNTLDKMLDYPFSFIKNNDTFQLFPDDYKMTENDILEYVIKDSGCPKEEILDEYISKESLKLFHENFKTLSKNFEKKLNHKNTNDKKSTLKM